MIYFFSKLFRKLWLAIKFISIPGGIKLWLTFFSLAYVGNSIFININNLAEISFDSSKIILLFIGILVSCVSIFFNAIAWRSLLLWLRYKPENVDIINLYISTNILKYLPGGVWHFVERLRVLMRSWEPSSALLSVVLEPLLMLSAALLFVPLGGWQSGISLVGIIPLALFFRTFREPIISGLGMLNISKLRVVLNGNKSSGDYTFKEGIMSYPWKPLVLEIIFVLTRFIGFWVCLKAFDLSSSLNLFVWLSSFSLSWAIGLVVPAAPGGVGIFETLVVFQLSSDTDESLLLAVLLSYRLIVTLSDFIMSILYPRRKSLVAFKSSK